MNTCKRKLKSGIRKFWKHKKSWKNNKDSIECLEETDIFKKIRMEGKIKEPIVNTGKIKNWIMGITVVIMIILEKIEAVQDLIQMQGDQEGLEKINIKT